MSNQRFKRRIKLEAQRGFKVFVDIQRIFCCNPIVGSEQVLVFRR